MVSKRETGLPTTAIDARAFEAAEAQANPAPAPTSTSSVFRGRSAALLGLSVACLAWAGAFIWAKIALTSMPAPSVAVWRYAIAALALMPFAARRKDPGAGTFPTPFEPSAGDHRRAWAAVTAMTLFGGVLYQWLFLGALARTSATVTSLLIALNPVLTLLFAATIGEQLDRRRAAGAGVAFIGAITVISHGDPTVLLGLHLKTGDAMALLAAACWAIFNLCSHWATRVLAPSRVNVVVYSASAILLALAAQPENLFRHLFEATPRALFAVAALGLLSSALAGQLFLFGVRRIGVSRSSSFIYLVPPLTAVLAAIFLGERLDTAQLVGGAAVVFGVVLTSRR